MKKIITLIAIMSFGLAISIPAPKNVYAKPAKGVKVNWMSFEKAEAYMKSNPKKVYIDMYTGWCHWCKVMTKKTLSNPQVVKYLNENFYCIKFDAESKADVTFQGRTFSYNKKRRVHELAVELMNGRLTYPTSVFLEENFKQGQPVPGYLKVRDMEMILKYMGENKNKTMPWTKYQSEFKPAWK